MSEHTPGPWAIRYSFPTHRGGSPACDASCGRGMVPRRVWSLGGEEQHEMPEGRAFEQMLGPNGEIIFGLGQDYDDYGDAPTDANARLIAAAPELLQALKALIGVDNPPAGEPGHIDYGTAVGMAALAIAKAEDRSHA